MATIKANAGNAPNICKIAIIVTPKGLLFFGLIYMASGYYFSSSSWVLSIFLGAIISFPIVYLFYKRTKNRKKWIEEERKKLDEERRKLLEE